MFANVERERERLVQAHQSKHSIGGSTSRKRERCVCVCVFLLKFVSFEFLLLFFTTYFKVCVDLCKKKSDRTRCLAVSILEYNINWNSKSAELGFLKEEVIHR